MKNLFPQPFKGANLAAALMAMTSFGAQAGLQNGDFSSNGGQGQLTYNTTLDGWTAGGKEGNFGNQNRAPVFVFNAYNAGGFVAGDSFMGNVQFIGVTAPPTGYYYIAAAGDSNWAGSISQTVTGLITGHSYDLKFDWAGAQQAGFSEPTTEQWRVNFSGSSLTLGLVNTPAQSFVGWRSMTLNLTAASTSEILSFMAIGTPNGQSPWLLLSGVTLTDTTAAVPEPETYALMLAGLAAVGFWARGQRNRKI
jgi:hypothetical protein